MTYRQTALFSRFPSVDKAGGEYFAMAGLYDDDGNLWIAESASFEGKFLGI